MILTHIRCDCAGTCSGTSPCKCSKKKPKTAEWIVRRGSRELQICDGCRGHRDQKIAMIVSMAYKIEVAPTPEQVIAFWQHCGLDRYVYNWALGERRTWWQKNRELPKKDRDEEPTYYVLSKRWTQEHPQWSDDLCRRAVEQSLKAVDFAFANFFRRLREDIRPYGYPKFKKKGECRDSFSLQVQNFWDHVQPWAFKLDKIGMLRTQEQLVPTPDVVVMRGERRMVPANQILTFPDGSPRPFVPETKHRWIRGVINKVAISRHADKWYAAIMVTRAQPIPEPVHGPVVGVDLGLAHVVTVSDGRQFAPSDHLERQLKRLRRLQRKAQRQYDAKANASDPDSGERKKQLAKVSKLHKHVADCRERMLHDVTTTLATQHRTVVTEGFDVRALGEKKGPTRRKKGARVRRRRIMSSGLGEIRRMLDYKSRWYGSSHLSFEGVTDQMCSVCGHVNEHMKGELSPKFNCVSCGHRDLRQKNTADLLERVGRGDPPQKEAAE